MLPLSVEQDFCVNNRWFSGKLWGQATSTNTLALHGWLDNAATFDALAPLLKKPLLAIDFAGHGYSQHCNHLRYYKIDDFLTDTLTLIEQLERPIHLIGHSMGAAVASLVASLKPQQLKSLVLIDLIGPISAQSRETHRQFDNHLHMLAFTRAKLFTKYESIEQMISVRRKHTAFSYKAAESIVTRNAMMCDGHYRWRTDNKLKAMAPYYMNDMQVSDLLHAIPKSVAVQLLIANETYQQRTVPVQQRIAAISHAEHHIIPGNHYLHYDCAQSCAEKINAFWASNL